MHPLELWGGAECTIARIGDGYRDEVHATGHGRRLDDLDRIAALGIDTLRMPILWETVAGADAAASWAWHDTRVERVRDLGMTPIAGLLHHGSGPPDTSLLDPALPERLAAHAAAVAARYPHIRHYTPVNEPLTTARFSALYGHWYPHARDNGAFFRALVNECKATLLAMRAIRQLRPDAVLVQTEDLGRTFSTPHLAYQADHDNARRWLSLDLLFGRVEPSHRFHGELTEAGIGEADLALLATGEGAPDIVGLNHYLTSDRFLDQRLHRYPPAACGGNAYERFADVEAVRVALPPGVLGPGTRIAETWERYRRPIAITEVSHGCTRDEQLRWLVEVWTEAEAARADGIDVMAVTPWAMFGSVDWRTLLTCRDDYYEPGVFDVRGPAPRPTALATAIAGLARDGTFDHPVLDGRPWWRRPERLYVPSRQAAAHGIARGARTLLLVGPDGAERDAFARVATRRGLDHVFLGPSEATARGAGGLADLLARRRVWAVVDTVAKRDVAGLLAGAARAARVPIASVSSAALLDEDVLDRVAGEGRSALTEDDAPGPIGAEEDVLAAHFGALLVRSGLPFGPWRMSGPVWSALVSLAAGRAADLPAASLSYLPDLADAVLDLLIDGESGVWHLINAPEASASDAVAELAAAAGLDAEMLGLAAELCLSTVRGNLLPPARSAIARFVGEGRVRERLRPPAHAPGLYRPAAAVAGT